MGRFYIISDHYSPNIAATNHALAFIKGFSDHGIIAEWIFILPSDKFDVSVRTNTVKGLYQNEDTINDDISVLSKYILGSK